MEISEGEREAPKNKMHGFSVDPCRSKLQVINKVTINLINSYKGQQSVSSQATIFFALDTEIQLTLV